MNVKNNSRKKASVEKIENAFMELLQTKNRGEITVSEISEKAGVNRSTFYANFLDMDDLETALKKRLLSEFRNVYKEEIKMRSGSNDFLKLFYHIKDNKMLYRAYFKLGASFTPMDIRYDKGQAEKYFGNEDIEYHLEFFYNGLNGIIKKWLENNCDKSPEEIEKILKTEYQGRKI